MKPILFSTEMVKAILDGRKTMTRRVMKNPNAQEPRYSVGDDLWVRETFRLIDFDYIDGVWSCSVHYKTGDIGTRLFFEEKDGDKTLGWRPSIFMPKEAARIFLKITDVRAERLQDITDADAKKEGCETREDFISVWESLNQKRGYGWDKNPFVSVYLFERIQNESL